MLEKGIQPVYERHLKKKKSIVPEEKVKAPSTTERKRTSPRLIDMTGQWGHWTVLHIDPVYSRQARWVCRCRCGTIKSIRGYCLRSGSSRSCGCAREESRNRKTHKPVEIGDLFGSLKVINKLPPRVDPKSGHTFHMWLCECQACGRATQVTSGALVMKGQRRCRCARTAARQYEVGMEIAGTKLIQQAPSSGRPEQGSMWHVACARCGKIITVSTRRLHTTEKRKNRINCGCMWRKIAIGDTVAGAKIIKRLPRKPHMKNKSHRWEVKCPICGKHTDYTTQKLREREKEGRLADCGCTQKKGVNPNT